VVSLDVADPEGTLLTVCENGYGKRTPISEYRETKRGGLGVRTILVNERNGDVAQACVVREDEALLLITEQGVAIRMKIEDLRPMSRGTQGVRLVRLDESDKLVAAVPVEREAEDEEIETVKPEEPTAEDVAEVNEPDPVDADADETDTPE
jgi:DNA gyrase subunit A